MDSKEYNAIRKVISKRSASLLKRYWALKSSCTTRRGNEYIARPDKTDYRWGLLHFGGCEPITLARAEKLITKMEANEKGGK